MTTKQLDEMQASVNKMGQRIFTKYEEDLIQSGEYCFDCDNTGKQSEQESPDDFEWVECHCKKLEKLELEANS